MAFQSFKTIGEVLQKYLLTYREESFVSAMPTTEAPLRLREEIDFTLREMTFNNSENAVCESLIFPVLKEVWRESFTGTLALWSHQALRYDKVLSGVPDYIISRRSPLGKVVFESPFLAAVEAKKDDFVRGWAQCAAEMLAVQKINGFAEEAVFGIVTSGKVWEIAKLEGQIFTKHPASWSIFDLDALTTALRWLFRECETISEQLHQTS